MFTKLFASSSSSFLLLATTIIIITFIFILSDSEEVEAAYKIQRRFFSDKLCQKFSHTENYEEGKCYPSNLWGKDSATTWSVEKSCGRRVPCAYFKKFILPNCSYPIAVTANRCNKCTALGDLGNEVLFCDPSGKYAEKRLMCTDTSCRTCAMNIRYDVNECSSKVAGTMLLNITTCLHDIEYTIWNNAKCVNTQGFSPQVAPNGKCVGEQWPHNGSWIAECI